MKTADAFVISDEIKAQILASTEFANSLVIRAAPLVLGSFRLACGINIDMRTGEVQIPDTLSLSEAALAFWREVSRLAPDAPPERRGFGE